MVDNPKKTDNVKCIEFLKLIFSHIRIPDWWLSPSITSRGGRMPTMENTNLRKTSDLESEGLLVFRIFLVEFSSGFNQPGTSRLTANFERRWHLLTQIVHVSRGQMMCFFLWKALFVFNFQMYTRFLKQGKCFLLRPNQNILRSRLQSWRPKNVVQTPEKRWHFCHWPQRSENWSFTRIFSRFTCLFLAWLRNRFRLFFSATWGPVLDAIGCYRKGS